MGRNSDTGRDPMIMQAAARLGRAEAGPVSRWQSLAGSAGHDPTRSETRPGPPPGRWPRAGIELLPGRAGPGPA